VTVEAGVPGHTGNDGKELDIVLDIGRGRASGADGTLMRLCCRVASADFYGWVNLIRHL
jgi:hypothetical protein